MQPTHARPRWWQLYALMPVTVGLFAGEVRLAVPPKVHQGIDIAIVVAVFVFVQWWLSANRLALIEEDLRRAHEHKQWSELPASQGGDPEGAAPTPVLFHLPPTGLRNTLGDTFELDDTESDSTHRRAD